MPDEVAVPSWSTNPTVTLLPPLPEKSTPKSRTNMIGKNNVQKRAALSRVRLLRLATVRPTSVFIFGS